MSVPVDWRKALHNKSFVVIEYCGDMVIGIWRLTREQITEIPATIRTLHEVKTVIRKAEKKEAKL